jgi:glycosyltransferase involved in cell wall biosynthesis
MIKYFDFYTYLRRMHPIDIVHIPYELHYKTKSKNTMTIHGMSPFIYPRNSPFENRFRRSLVASTKYVTKYISVSQKTKDEMIRYLSLADRDIVPIPISLEDHFFNQKRSISPTGPLEIVCYGAFERNKNHKNLIKALDSIYNRDLLKFRLVVIGHIKWGLEEAVKYLARPYIRNIGYVNHRELTKILSTASCVIIPSIYEGFGLSLVESLAMGTPVLASHTIHALDYVKEGYIGFNPFSSDEIISAIMAFSRDRMRYEAAAGRERDRLKRTLHLRNMAFLLRDVYEDIIAIQ